MPPKYRLICRRKGQVGAETAENAAAGIAPNPVDAQIQLEEEHQSESEE